jgi:hypothetical protein
MAANSVVARIKAATETKTLKSPRNERIGLSIYNDSTADLYVKLGAGASTSSFTVIVPAAGFYEVSVGDVDDDGEPTGCYSGIITGVWASVNGYALVTEVYV